MRSLNNQFQSVNNKSYLITNQYQKKYKVISFEVLLRILHLCVVTLTKSGVVTINLKIIFCLTYFFNNFSRVERRIKIFQSKNSWPPQVRYPAYTVALAGINQYSTIRFLPSLA